MIEYNRLMVIDLFVWWYTDGFRKILSQANLRTRGVIDFFSIRQLFGTLFYPFRQISAGPAGGSLSNQVIAFFDRQLSRVVGTVARLILILIGSTVVALDLLLSLAGLIIWLIIPLLPALLVALFVMGYML